MELDDYLHSLRTLALNESPSEKEGKCSSPQFV